MGINRSVRPKLFEVVAVASLLACGCQRDVSQDLQGNQALNPVLLATSDSTVEFSQVTGIDVDSKGRIYAGDRLGEIVVLEPNGHLVRRFGRMGGGPGEFQLVGMVHLLPDDSLYVFDGAALRATVYAPNSTRVAYTVRFPEPSLSFPMDVQPLRNGAIIAHFRRINGDFPGAEVRRGDMVRMLNRDGSIRRDSVLLTGEPEVVELRNGSAHGFFSPRFARQPLVEWDSDGRIYSLWTDSAQVSVYDPTGRRTAAFPISTLGGERLLLGDATIDSAAALNAGEGLTSRMLSEAFRSRWQTWPLVEQMLVDDQSRVWIKPVTHDSIGDWFAFTAKGERVASFRLPQTVVPRLIRGDRLYGVSRDSLDVESVVVYRLTPSSTRTPERP